MIPPPSSVFFAFLFFKIKNPISRPQTEGESVTVYRSVQLQLLWSKGCTLLRCTANFNFFFIFSQPVENIIYGQALRLLILANLINQSLYFVRPPNCHLWAKLDWGGVATVFDA